MNMKKKTRKMLKLRAIEIWWTADSAIDQIRPLRETLEVPEGTLMRRVDSAFYVYGIPAPDAVHTHFWEICEGEHDGKKVIPDFGHLPEGWKVFDSPRDAPPA